MLEKLVTQFLRGLQLGADGLGGGVCSAVLARGDADADSDIDLRIDKGAIRGLQMGGLAADLEDAFGIPVDLVPTGSLDKKFLRSISDDEVLLYEAS